ncbi:MAG: VOC family protein [Ferruginibacter sp.]|nr:VOC family protein [Cytophagales bacterium]
MNTLTLILSTTIILCTMIKCAVPLVRVSSSISAEDFYCHQLGFTKVFANRPDASKADPCYFGVSRDGTLIHLSSFSGDGIAGHVINLFVNDVDALRNEFVSKGVKIDLEPTNQTWDNREMYVRDADNNCLRFLQEGVSKEA